MPDCGCPQHVLHPATARRGSRQSGPAPVSPVTKVADSAANVASCAAAYPQPKVQAVDEASRKIVLCPQHEFSVSAGQGAVSGLNYFLSTGLPTDCAQAAASSAQLIHRLARLPGWCLSQRQITLQEIRARKAATGALWMSRRGVRSPIWARCGRAALLMPAPPIAALSAGGVDHCDTGRRHELSELTDTNGAAGWAGSCHWV
jgi:hypothetical protein